MNLKQKSISPSNRCLLKMAPNFSPKTVHVAKMIQNDPKTVQNGSKTLQNASKGSKTVQNGWKRKKQQIFFKPPPRRGGGVAAAAVVVAPPRPWPRPLPWLRRPPPLRLWLRRIQKSHLFEWPSLATFHYPFPIVFFFRFVSIFCFVLILAFGLFLFHFVSRLPVDSTQPCGRQKSWGGICKNLKDEIDK